MCTLAWSWTEVVRFSFYTLKQLKIEANTATEIINFFRYNSFFLLYPLGVGGELLSSYHAWTQISSLPNLAKPYLIDLRPDIMPFDWVELGIKWVMPIVYAVFFP